MNLGQELYQTAKRGRPSKPVRLNIYDKLLISFKTTLFMNDCRIAAQNYQLRASSAPFKNCTPREKAIVREVERKMTQEGIHVTRENNNMTTCLVAAWGLR